MSVFIPKILQTILSHSICCSIFKCHIRCFVQFIADKIHIFIVYAHRSRANTHTRIFKELLVKWDETEKSGSSWAMEYETG